MLRLAIRLRKHPRRSRADLGENRDRGRRVTADRKIRLIATHGALLPEFPGYLEPGDGEARITAQVQAETPMIAPGDATRPPALAPGRSWGYPNEILAAPPCEQKGGTLSIAN